MRVTLVQMNSQDRKEENVRFVEDHIERAARDDRSDLVVFPECFAFLDDDAQRMRASGEPASGEICARLAAAARKFGITVHAGSIIEQCEEHFYNTTFVFGPGGTQIARYRKIHMCDIDTPGGVSLRESEVTTGGSEVVTYKIGALTVGCATCYDLRFPELFRKLRDQGADVIVLPAAFTLGTGKDHWEVLLRARAIDTQTYILAAAQVHSYGEGRKWSWGHSLVADPWGKIIARASDFVGSICTTIEPGYTRKVRSTIPVAHHHVLS